MFKPKQKIPIITELAFPQPQIFCMQQAALQAAEIMDRIWRSRADAVSDPSPPSPLTLSAHGRVSHVPLTCLLMLMQVFTFLPREGNAWVTTAVEFL